MTKLRLRPPSPTFERAKRALFILGFAAAIEIADPMPFSQSRGAWLLYAFFAFEVVKQFVLYRMEVSRDAVLRAKGWRLRADRIRNRATPDARYRLRRFVTLLASLYLLGWGIDQFSDRCDGAFQCMVLFPRLAMEALPTFLMIALSIAFGLLQLFFMFYAMVKVGFFKTVYPGTIEQTFDDVYGQDDAKQRVVEQVALLEDASTIEAAGGYMPKGILLHGPPGTGKTMLAKAAANASTKPLILIPPGGFASTFIGINFLKVASLFRTIRKLAARHGGLIVFFDEIDSLGNRGGEIEGAQPMGCTAPSLPEGHTLGGEANVIVTGGGGGMNMGTLEAFLSAMDGMEEPRGLINKILSLAGFKPLAPPKYRYLMVGATNRLSTIDPALLRAGRFGRKIHVDYPKFQGRLKTYQGYLGKISHGLADQEVEWLARNHHRGTGAEIQDVVNEALLLSFRSGGSGVVSYQDLLTATLWKRHGESDGPFEVDKHRWSTAVHEAGHAVVLHHLLRHRKRIWFASIERRGQTGGMVAWSPIDDDWEEFRSELMGSIAVSLASRVAETMLLDEMSNGHGGDGRAATFYAGQMVELGMSKTLSYAEDATNFTKQREKILREGLALAERVLTENRTALEAVAHLLYDDLTVTGEKVHEVIDAAVA